MISSKEYLGLCLAWTQTRGSCFVLQMLFSMSITSVSMYLHFGRRLLIKVLKNDKDARIEVPDKDKIKEYQTIIAKKYPPLAGTWCCMDGLKLTLERSGDSTIQNNYYNGWTHDHYMSAVFVFCPDGTIPICCYNVPGSIHDSTIARIGGIYEKLEDVYNKYGGICVVVVDIAFKKRGMPS